ncbi:hypothetical protein TNCV_1612221 [Trichonephila clavipes]|nr:hypothetical protein TNCV_1612221 [Trichonephila clavipes]
MADLYSSPQTPTTARQLCVRGSLVVKVTDSWPACHEFEPNTVEDPPCSEAMDVKFIESSNVLPCGGVWYSGEVVPAQVSSTSLDHGSKLRSSSPKALE